MCSNDLLNALPAEAYTALDASSHLEITARAKLHKSIESSGLGNQLDLAIAAPRAFGYQTSQQHSRGAPWNPLARGTTSGQIKQKYSRFATRSGFF